MKRRALIRYLIDNGAFLQREGRRHSIYQRGKYRETVEKEVQDASCRGSGGVPQLYKFPQEWGVRDAIDANESSLCLQIVLEARIPSKRK